jgi:DNA repair ATPase RecN
MTTSHPRILSLAVTGGGFLDNVTLDFADGLNCILGGRGVGKTTILQATRFALGADGDGSTVHDLVKGNLGTARATVQFVTAHGVRYTASRALGTSTSVLDATGVVTDAAIEQLFPIDFTGQNEIEQIGKDDAIRLRLIDSFAVDELRVIAATISSAVVDLEQNASDLIRLANLEREKSVDATEAPTLEEQLKGLTATPGPEDHALRAAHDAASLRERERQTVAVVGEALKKSRSDAQRFAEALARRFPGLFDESTLRGSNKDLVGALSAHVTKAAASLQAELGRMNEACEICESEVREENRTLAARHAAQEEAYRTLLVKGQQEASRAAERRTVQQKLAAAQAARNQLEQLSIERRSLEQRRRDLVAKLSELRDQRTGIRTGVAIRLSTALAGKVQVKVEAPKVMKPYADFLGARLKNSRIQYGKLLEALSNFHPAELAGIVRRGDAERLSSQAVLQTHAHTIIEKLREGTTVFELEVFEIPTLATIELWDGAFKDVSKVSPGQCATAILPIILLRGDRTLVIDQPEDQLDPRYLCDVIIESLRIAKVSRQIIVVTHSPNIPVVGDAERVFSIESDGKRVWVRAAGTLAEMAGHIQDGVEGGAKAFQLRKDRYGY